MFETVGALSGLVPDDLVVVGKVPLRAKAGRARLEKIRDDNLTRAERGRQRILGQPAPRAAALAAAAPRAAGSLFELPADVQLQVVHAAGPRAAGPLAATSAQAATAFWHTGPWAAWSGGVCANWDEFRQWRFGLEDGWRARLLKLPANFDAPEVLARAAAALQGLTPPYSVDADKVADVLDFAAGRCPASAALVLVDKALSSLERTARFPLARRRVRATRGDLLEREIVEGLDAVAEQEHEALAFDYFADLEEPGDFWDELEALDAGKPGPDDPEDPDAWPEEPEEPAAAPGLDRALAAEFVEALGLHHRHDWATTAAAMHAVQQ